jgi:2-desacetyl-2-hydroxyethyl bacteriochlorophyllide A dehydrogenase
VRAVVIPEPGRVEVTTVPDPSPDAGEVVVAVHRCGICGTDQHLLAGDVTAARYPLIPGHEFAGEVVAVGSGPPRIAVGDRVAVDPRRSCGGCRHCRAGWPNQCLFRGGHGTARPGGLAELVAVPAASCERLPDGVDAIAGALAEPLACALHGIETLGPVLGQRVLVFGAGPIGLMMAALARRAGASEVAMIDHNPDRLHAVDAFGVHRAATSAAEAGAPGAFDTVIDATGSPAAMEDGIAALDRRGRLLIMGVARPDARVSFSPFDLNWRELRILGSASLRHDFGHAVGLLAGGVIPVGRLVTATVGLDGFANALGELGSGSALKTQVDPRAA